MIHSNATTPSAPASILAAGIVTLVGISAAVAFALQFMPARLFSGDGVAILSVVSALVFILLIGLASTRAIPLTGPKVLFRLGLLIWTFLLISEALFDHPADAVNSYRGSYAVQAYGEALVWIISLAFLALISLPHLHFVNGLFKGNLKWATLFTAVCLCSIAYTPDKTYALAWCFKLVLVLLLLAICLEAGSNAEDVTAFFAATFWGFFFLTAVPILRVLLDPSAAFNGAGGRLEDPTLLSERAATLALVSLILYTLKRRAYLKVGLAFGAIIMILAMGKTSIIAAVLAACTFLLIQGKVARAIQLFISSAVLTIATIFVVPQLSAYLSRYQGLDTLTGRTNLWLSAIGGIKHHPILGHGYLSSRYIWLSQSGKGASFAHMHNGFLDILYNVGVIGLLPILVIHIIIVRDLLRCLKIRPLLSMLPAADVRYQTYVLASGCAAIYVNVFLNGLLRTIFGGKPIAGFMLFLALLPLTALLRREVSFQTSGTGIA